MKKSLLCLALTFFFGAGYAVAQVTATPIQMGYLTTTGCPSGSFVCWMPYTAANPLPTGSF